MHDVVDDPKLSKEPVKVKLEDESNSESEEEWNVPIKEEPLDGDELNDRKQRIKDKLKSRSSEKIKKNKPPIKIEEVSNSDDDQLLTHEDEKRLQKEKKKFVSFFFPIKLKIISSCFFQGRDSSGDIVAEETISKRKETKGRRTGKESAEGFQRKGQKT